jgi:signal transduction histidine kinase/ActR/RegA family two-component response regulator
MSATEPSKDTVENRMARLIRSNEALREESHRLADENARLTKRLMEVLADSDWERSARRAALNLLEDAEAARIAERHELEERRRAEEELREANQRKDEFLATLAHELRNPLAPIRNSLNILRLAGHDNGSAGRVHEMMERQVNHMVRLVDDLLDVSRVSRGKIELRKEPVELAAVVRSAVELSKPFVDGGKHQLAISLPAEPLTVFGDPVRLTQVVGNLLNNAAKFTETGGQIWLTVRAEGSDAVISVRDTGIGIPPDFLPKVFDLFTQNDRRASRKYGGLGIGLSLVRSLVLAHEGTVEARSPGLLQGSEFVVHLPLTTQTPQPPNQARRQPVYDFHLSGKILVVDDNRDAAQTLGTLLRRSGAEVIVAESGPVALEAFQKHRPTIALIDIGMPGMDGNEVARRVRLAPETRNATLIALTGWGQDDDRRRCREAGFNHHLVKPVDLDALQELLASIPPRAQDLATGNTLSST